MKHSTTLVFIRIALAMAALFWNFTGASAAEDAIDFQRLRALRARVVAGEKLSPEDQAYYDRGAEEWNRLHGKRSKAPAETAPPAKPATTAEPLPDKDMREVKAKGSEGFSVSLEACPLQTVKVPAPEGHTVPAVIRKPPGEGPFPALIHLHGSLDTKKVESLSGWSKDATASRFLAAGYLLVTPTFRSREDDPQTRDALADCLTVIEYVKHRPDVDPASVVVWGDSGGGSLALELAGETDLAAVAGQEPATILFCGLLSKEHPDRYAEMADPKKYWTPELQAFTRAKIQKIHCPVFIAYGDISSINKINTDIVIPELQAAGKQVEAKLYPGQHHGFSRGSKEFFDDADAFFRKTLRTPPKAIATELTGITAKREK